MVMLDLAHQAAQAMPARVGPVAHKTVQDRLAPNGVLRTDRAAAARPRDHFQDNQEDHTVREAEAEDFRRGMAAPALTASSSSPTGTIK
jgi:hypothetical protein